jgi:hypothetical protein
MAKLFNEKAANSSLEPPKDTFGTGKATECYLDLAAQSYPA